MNDPWRPRRFTSAEAMLESVRDIIQSDGRTRKEIAKHVGVSPSTITNLAMGKTRWPRHTTLFPLLSSLGLSIRIDRK